RTFWSSEVIDSSLVPCPPSNPRANPIRRKTANLTSPRVSLLGPTILKSGRKPTRGGASPEGARGRPHCRGNFPRSAKERGAASQAPRGGEPLRGWAPAKRQRPICGTSPDRDRNA